MRITVLCLALLVAFAGCATHQPADVSQPAVEPTAAEPTAVDAAGPSHRPGFVKRTLDNGLVILCQENRAAPIAIVQAFVRAGSIFEDGHMGAGISHYVEHVVSGGSTTTRPEAETQEMLDELGGASNAYTTYDHTGYFIRTTADKFPKASELIADWLQNAAFEQDEVDREYEVIQREIEKSASEPSRVLWNLSARTMYRFHPMRHPILGYLEQFKQLTRDDLVAYHERMYGPDNIVIVAVGDFDADEAADHIASLFEDAERASRTPAPPADDPQQQGTREATAEMDVRSGYAMMSFRTVPLSHPDLYPLDVMSRVLSHGPSSRLVQRLREEDGLVESISSWSWTPWFGGGNFSVRMQLDPANIPAARQAVLEELDKLKTEPVTEEELARARRQTVAAEVFGRQTIEAQARRIGGDYLATGDPFFTETYLEGIRGVQAEEIREVARKYLNTDNLTVSVVRPEDEPVEPEEPVEAEAVHPEPTEKITLDNGLRVLIKRNPALPLVSMQAYFLGGVLREDEATAGTSHVLGRMLTRGTESRTALDIARAFDDLGGRIEGGSGNNTVFLTAGVLAEDFEQGFDIFADCLVNPSFPEDELDTVKTLTTQAIRRQDDDWHTQALNLLRSTLYREAPYRLNRLGTETSVQALTPDTLGAFHRRAFTGENGVIAVFGDVDVEQVKKLVADRLGGLPAGESLLADIPDEPPLEEDRKVVELTRRPGTAVVYAGYPATTLTDVEDRYPLMVLDGVMSGVGWPSGWLHRELRGQGLVYVVHAYVFQGIRVPGFFGIYALTQPDKVDEVVSIIDENIERAKADLVPEDQFERSKEMVVTVELLRRQTNESLATQAALDELYGLGHDFADTFAERVRAVTREDVLRVARKYFTHRAKVIVRPEHEPDGE